MYNLLYKKEGIETNVKYHINNALNKCGLNDAYLIIVGLEKKYVGDLAETIAVAQASCKNINDWIDSSINILEKFVNQTKSDFDSVKTIDIPNRTPKVSSQNTPM